MELQFSRFWCAQFETDDNIGEVLALASMIPYFVILHAISRCYCRRDLTDMASLVGLVLNEVVARGLKHALKQPRPIDRCADLGTCSSYGSPSSHAQCMFFALAMYAALPLLQHRYPVNTQSPITQDYADAWFAKGSKRVFERVLHAVEMGGLALAAAAVGTSRVYLKYHSLDQVMLGAVLGILSGLIWATLMAAGAPFLGYFASAHPLGKVMSLRSSWGVLRVMAVEREAVHAAAGYKLSKGD